MNERLIRVAAYASGHHSVIPLPELDRLGVDRWLRYEWTQKGWLVRLGPRSFTMAGSAPGWMRDLAAAAADTAPSGFVDGRSAARLYGLDGFTTDALEILVPYANRMTSAGRAVVRTTRQPIGPTDVRIREGLRVATPERLILDAPIFHFTPSEITNAIDSAIRLRLVAEDRLRQRVLANHRPGRRGARALLDALIDTGGESYLERTFLRLVRRAGLPRPTLQVTYRSNGRVVARVDARFGSDLVVELAGHGTHSTRRQRQIDEQRRTELTLAGLRVLTFTYDDVTRRPEWVVSMLRIALNLAC